MVVHDAKARTDIEDHFRKTIGKLLGSAAVLIGVSFRSITEAIDTTTPAGRMMMQMVGAFAEFERAMIQERTSADLAAARAEGHRRSVQKARSGQAPRNRRSVISGRETGAEMARLYNVSAPTVSRIVAQHRMVGS